MYHLNHQPSQISPAIAAPQAGMLDKAAGASSMPHSARAGNKVHLTALLGYFLLALLVTYPTIRHFTTQVPGDLIADRDQNLWNIWWLRYAITHATNPFHTGLLYYPFGVDLYYHTLAMPLGLIGLAPQVLWGLPAAYNTVLLVAFTLSGYGAFRLGLLLAGTHAGRQDLSPQAPHLLPFAAFLGGVVFAFTPYTLDALKGQPEVLSLQWMPFYVEAWLRAWRSGRVRYGVVAGIFLALAALSSLYYALYLVIFSAAYLLYHLLQGTKTPRRKDAKSDAKDSQGNALTQNSKLKAQNWSALAVTPLVALLLTLPLVIGLASNHSDPRLAVEAGPEHRLAHSADLLSFFAPPHDHPLLGGNAAMRPGVEEPPMHDYLGLGYVALALAVLGAVVVWQKRQGEGRFWVALGLVALLLAMGSQLQIGRHLTGIPLPFALLQNLPGFDAIAKPERLVVLARLCMGALATWGAAWVLVRLRRLMGNGGMWRRALPFAAVLALLLVELPIHARYVEPLNIPEGFRMLASQPEGGLMELPFATQQNEVAGARMLYQTTHGHPIMTGYLARSYNSPIVDSCGPFWSFISARYLPIEGRDIVSPTMTSRPLDILNFYGIKYLAVYNNYNGPNSDPLDPDEKAAYDDITAHVSHASPLYQDGYVGLHRVDTVAPASIQPALMVGDGWYDAEGGDMPFRWMKGREAGFCIFMPKPGHVDLVLNVTGFAQQRMIYVYAGDDPVRSDPLYGGTVPVAGREIRASLQLQAGMNSIILDSPEPGVTPQSLDPKNKDKRPLTIGVRDVRLDTDPPK